ARVRRWRRGSWRSPGGDHAARNVEADGPEVMSTVDEAARAEDCVSFPAMTTAELRRKIKKYVDRLPPKRLESLADYVEFLNRPPIAERLKAAERSIASGKGVNWRKVRSDV